MKTQSLAENIALKLEEAIIIGEYSGGTRLPEIKLAKDLDVSRSTIREALLLLQRRHLIEIHTNCGAVVTQITPADVFFLGKMAKVLLTCTIEDVARAIWTEQQTRDFETILTQTNKASEEKDTLAVYIHTFEFINLGMTFSKRQGNHYLIQMLKNILPCLRRDLYRSFQLNPHQALDKAVSCLNLMYDHTKAKRISESQQQLYELIDLLMEILTTALLGGPQENKAPLLNQKLHT